MEGMKEYQTDESYRNTGKKKPYYILIKGSGNAETIANPTMLSGFQLSPPSTYMECATNSLQSEEWNMS